MSTKNADGIDMKCNSNDVIGELLDSKEDHCILVIASDIHSNMDKKVGFLPKFWADSYSNLFEDKSDYQDKNIEKMGKI